MIFKVSMKDPDTLYDSVEEAVQDELERMTNIDDEERSMLQESRAEKVREQASRWFQYGEYLTVEIDTEKNTIRVVPANE